MTVKTFELETLKREEWLAMDKQKLEDQLEMLDKEYPLVLHTDAGRIFSTVRRMSRSRLSEQNLRVDEWSVCRG